MTIATPFDRSSRTNHPSIVLDQDLLDAIDHVRVSENGERPLSRSATIRYLLSFALALICDDDAIEEFVAEHISEPATRSA